MRAALFCSALASVFLIDACGSSCPAKDKLCSGVCSDLTSDSQNCGACGNACAAGFTCSAGACSVVCPTGSTACDNLCVNPDTDQANCGTCGTKCPSGQACNAGVCGTSCLAGFTPCGSDGGQLICANELTDSANCGACGHPCPAGSVCNGNGSCAESCAAGFSVCGATAETAYCANFTTDNQNCGSCTAPCPSGEACSAGHCATTCAAGYSSCSGIDGGIGICADFLTDSNNCSACGKACPSGQSCAGGTCAETCGAGFSACGGGDGGAPFCANFLTDSAHCGGCAKPCPSGQVCNGSGACTESCATGFSPCAATDAGAGPYCANLTNDTNNCAVCGKACASGETCQSSACTETCAKGFSVCSNSYCADLTSDVNNCGTCNTNCGNSFSAPGCCGSTCTSLSSGDVNNCGTCGNACTSGAIPGCCAAGCVDQSNDPNNCGGCGTVCPFGLCLASNCCTEACGTDATTTCPGSCGKSGACGHLACGPGYGCDFGATCKTSCATDADCAFDGGYSCWNPPGGSCCQAVANGATIYVDGDVGADTNCCDSSATACKTLTYAMGQIATAGATGVTIMASWNNNPKVRADWSPAGGETYPVHLGYGVTLQAPGIFFTPPVPKAGSAAVDAFDVYAYATTDTGTVTIEGSSTDYMFIGFNSRQKVLTGTAVAVNDGVGSQTAVPLTLNKVWMNGQTEALNIGASADVSLGPSPVIIGSGASTANPLPLVMSPGVGIYCKGASGSTATLTDLDAGGSTVLMIDQQDTGFTQYTAADILAYDYCDITLSQSPIIGVPPPCPSPKVDGEGILVDGASTLSLTGATVQCMDNHGIDIGENTSQHSADPTVEIYSTLIQHTGQTGFKCNDGSASATNSTVYHCRFGVVMENSGTLSNGTAASSSIDLSGGGNIVACNTNKEPGGFPAAVPAGMNVWNDSTNDSINASNLLWDNSPPSYWTCTDAANGSAATTCTCQSTSCNGTSVAVPDDSDAVVANNTNSDPINMSDAGTQSTYTCN